jgi:hypothetical protein
LHEFTDGCCQPGQCAFELGRGRCLEFDDRGLQRFEGKVRIRCHNPVFFAMTQIGDDFSQRDSALTSNQIEIPKGIPQFLVDGLSIRFEGNGIALLFFDRAKQGADLTK